MKIGVCGIACEKCPRMVKGSCPNGNQGCVPRDNKFCQVATCAYNKVSGFASNVADFPVK